VPADGGGHGHQLRGDPRGDAARDGGTPGLRGSGGGRVREEDEERGSGDRGGGVRALDHRTSPLSARGRNGRTPALRDHREGLGMMSTRRRGGEHGATIL